MTKHISNDLLVLYELDKETIQLAKMVDEAVNCFWHIDLYYTIRGRHKLAYVIAAEGYQCSIIKILLPHAMMVY